MTNNLNEYFEIERLKDSFTIDDFIIIKNHLLSSLVSDGYDKNETSLIVTFINSIDEIILTQLTKN